MLNFIEIKPPANRGKRNILWVLKMAVIYSFIGLMFQAFLVNILLASSPASAQSLKNIKINIKAVEVTLGEAFNIVENETGFTFSYFGDSIPLKEKLSIDVEGETLYTLLENFAKDYGLVFNRINDQITVRKTEWKEEEKFIPVEEKGSLRGKVTDFSTKEPLYGANILIKGTGAGTATDENGNYELLNLAPGNYTLVARYIGYVTKTEVVNVSANKTTELNIALKSSTVGMNEIVVTGYMTETELRKVETPITVVNAKDLERVPVQSLADIFKGFVPGATVQNNGALFNWISPVYVRGASSLGTNQTKLYIDGVEASFGSFTGVIDKNSIKKIEVTRGLGATTLYGSEASGGVIQIFTKKGDTGSRLSLSIAGGFVESEWLDNTPAMQEYNIEYSGGVPGFSYQVGGSYQNKQEYLPSDEDDNFFSVYAGAKATSGPTVVDFNIKYSKKEIGNTLDPRYDREGFPANFRTPHYTKNEVPQITIGTNINYVASKWWVHNLSIGFDQTENNSYGTQPRLTHPGDTLIIEQFIGEQVINLRYNSTVFYPSKGDFKSKITFGGEWSRRSTNNTFGHKETTFGNNLTIQGATSTRDDRNYGGYFIQWQPELWDKLFITAGIRAELSDLFQEFGTAVSPRIGAAYNFEFDEMLIKPRISYGKGLRGVTRQFRDGLNTQFFQILPNLELKPESQSGVDFGIDLSLLNGLLNIETTYYNQIAENLIDLVFLETTPTFKSINQAQNVGEIENKGFEFVANYSAGAFDIRGTYSITSSKVNEVSSVYTGTYKVGDDVNGVAKSSGNIRVSYSFDKAFGIGENGSVSLELNYRGPWREIDWVAFNTSIYTGEPPFLGSLAAYVEDYDPVTKMNFALNYNLTNNLAIFLNVWNLTNNTDPEYSNQYLYEGRRLLVGSRITL